ncbi:MAG TPA: lipocalin family protein, partial [Flavobacterium sp.]|nr:lipocalin family protein [Flavobacterium sp.]
MKSIKLFLAVVIASAFTMTSCSNDDDAGISTDGNIVGTWNYNRTITNLNGQETSQEYTSHEPGCEKDFQEFVAGGVFRDVVIYKNASNVCTEDAESGTWTKSGNTLTLTGNEAGTYQIIRLDGS